MDNEERQRILACELNIAKLNTFFIELASVVWGDNRTRDNGLRSKIEILESDKVEITKDLFELRNELRYYLDVKRKETCHGIKELEAYKEESGKTLEEVVDVKVATINAGATKYSASIGARAAVIVQLLVLIGGFALLYFKP